MTFSTNLKTLHTHMFVLTRRRGRRDVPIPSSSPPSPIDDVSSTTTPSPVDVSSTTTSSPGMIAFSDDEGNRDYLRGGESWDDDDDDYDVSF